MKNLATLNEELANVTQHIADLRQERKELMAIFYTNAEDMADWAIFKELMEINKEETDHATTYLHSLFE
jgi:hypothetical protein